MVTIDGTDISGATIDGADVQEITVDGDVVWTATNIYREDWERFSNGDNSDPEGYWSFDKGEVMSSSYYGSKSYGLFEDNVSRPVQISETTDPEQVTDPIEMVYWENSDSQGTFYVLWTEDDEVLLAFGTDNPEAFVYGTDGQEYIEENPNPKHEEWREFILTIDWDDKSYELQWNDLTGDTSGHNVTGSLRDVTNYNIKKIEISPSSSDIDSELSGSSSGHFHSYVDIAGGFNQ